MFVHLTSGFFKLTIEADHFFFFQIRIIKDIILYSLSIFKRNYQRTVNKVANHMFVHLSSGFF